MIVAPILLGSPLVGVQLSRKRGPNAGRDVVASPVP
jgi:hypothetical protein